jgi:serine/threonine protein kinase
LYEVHKAVGKGGYAVVFKGTRKEDGRIVAVKKVEVSGADLCTWLESSAPAGICLTPYGIRASLLASVHHNVHVKGLLPICRSLR